MCTNMEEQAGAYTSLNTHSDKIATIRDLIFNRIIRDLQTLCASRSRFFQILQDHSTTHPVRDYEESHNNCLSTHVKLSVIAVMLITILEVLYLVSGLSSFEC